MLTAEASLRRAGCESSGVEDRDMAPGDAKHNVWKGGEPARTESWADLRVEATVLKGHVMEPRRARASKSGLSSATGCQEVKSRETWKAPSGGRQRQSQQGAL